MNVSVAGVRRFGPRVGKIGSAERPSTSVNATDWASSETDSLIGAKNWLSEDEMLETAVALVTVGERETIEPDEGEVSRGVRFG